MYSPCMVLKLAVAIYSLCYSSLADPVLPLRQNISQHYQRLEKYGCERAGLDIEQVIDEFGLERRDEYFQRADAIRAAVVAEGTGSSNSHPAQGNG